MRLCRFVDFSILSEISFKFFFVSSDILCNSSAFDDNTLALSSRKILCKLKISFVAFHPKIMLISKKIIDSTNNPDIRYAIGFKNGIPLNAITVKIDVIKKVVMLIVHFVCAVPLSKKASKGVNSSPIFPPFIFLHIYIEQVCQYNVMKDIDLMCSYPAQKSLERNLIVLP